MKIHTVRKYLTQLPTEPIRNLSAHYKTLSDAVCKNLAVRPINGITLAVVGQDAAYTAMSVSAALKLSEKLGRPVVSLGSLYMYGEVFENFEKTLKKY